MAPPKEVVELVEHFDRNADAYRSGNYSEAQLRQEFLNPFFWALGWDVENRQGFAEAYKDVIHEDSVKIEGETKAPDYSFRIGETRKFFVEAKKPSVNLKEDPKPAFQLRRYAWTVKLPLSLLASFAELAVYDCRVQPFQTDKASTARISYYTYPQYLEQWDELSGRFSKDAVWKGSFDKFIESTRAKKGTAEVDEAFLKEIEEWRKELASNIALRNPKLSQREVNFAVQRTIDRIIFLRICEDRGIEKYGQLRELQRETDVYRALCTIFERADERYNSGLFHFQQEKDRAEAPDELTLRLRIDDPKLKGIFKRLYYPESSYEFSVLPADILGQVYEQFLGKVIHLTAGHFARVEDKPEVKKAGGVYYTPTYIVDYIVKNTVGKLLENKTPKQAAKLRILDAACGSGSFLIAAYQYLLNWHRDRYLEDGAEKHRKELYQSSGGTWRLTISEKKRVLRNNIYGVDIDAQAVEVTKLSLLLKVLEGESEQTLNTTYRMFHERALPDLGDNIKCGNSLIAPDFYQGKQMSFLDEEERYRINVFDWSTEFDQITKLGGFDAVIGNPPYGAFVSAPEVEYLRKRYVSDTRDTDTYCLFIERATGLAKPGGKIGMIVPTGWYSGPKFTALRSLVAEKTDPDSFVNLPYDIFSAWVDTTVFVLTQRQHLVPLPRTDRHQVRLLTFPKRHRIRSVSEFENAWANANFSDWFVDSRNEYLTYADAETAKILRKMEKSGVPLGQLADVQRGVTPFELSDRPTHKTSRPAFTGTVRRYRIEMGPRRYIRFDGTLAEPKPERYFEGPRLLLRELISRQFQLQAAKVTKDFVTNKSMQSILAVKGGPKLEYLLGVINSCLMSWYFLRRSNIAQRDDFPKIVLKESRNLPIAWTAGMPTARECAYDSITGCVDQMLALCEDLRNSKTEHETSTVKRQIEATDRQIDKLVYELYSLTDKEIAIVEGSAQAAGASA